MGRVRVAWLMERGGDCHVAYMHRADGVFHGRDAPIVDQQCTVLNASCDQTSSSVLRTVLFSPGGRAGPPDPPRAPPDAPRRPDRTRAPVRASSEALLSLLGPPAAGLCCGSPCGTGACLGRGRTGTVGFVPG